MLKTLEQSRHQDKVLLLLIQKSIRYYGNFMV